MLTPPAIIMTDPEVIALCPDLAWAKFPIFFQFPSLYSAIVDMRLGDSPCIREPSVLPPMIKTLSSVWTVAYPIILKIKLYACDFKNCCWPRIITSKIYIRITIRKWVIGQYFPLICFHIENFGLQSIRITVGRILTGNKWWVPVRSERPDAKMFIIGWRFCFERFSIKSRNVISFSSLLIWTYEWHSFEA